MPCLTGHRHFLHPPPTQPDDLKFPQLNRVIHRWGSIVIALPISLVIGTGILLQVKKQFAWIQPTTQRSDRTELTLSFDQILQYASEVSQAEIQRWDDVDRLDVRPGKGMLKVRAKNRWEIQMDSATGEILQVAYRRSDLIESLHDGSFFHDHIKLWLFLPSGLILLVLWLTGLYLFFLPHWIKWKRQRRQ